MRATLATSLILTSSCASQLVPSSGNRASTEAKKLQALKHRLKKQAAILEDLKERNLVLEKREHTRAADKLASEISDEGDSIASPAVSPELPAPLPHSFAAPSRTQTAKHLVTPPEPAASVSTEKTGEHYLYSKILETYRSRNVAQIERTLELLLKTYPESVFADNAIYMSGLLAFESGDYKAALKKFDLLLKDYPRSNKAVAALFAKASIEKRSGHAPQAKHDFLQLRDLYPGSPEAARVAVELKLLDSASSKHREL